MLDPSARASPLFALAEEQVAIRDMARAFAAENFAPHALAWDEAKHFPVDEMRKAAALGMGGDLYRARMSAAPALTRFDAALIFEALATGCPTVAAFMSIHNMVAWMIDAFGSDDAAPDHGCRNSARWSMLASYCLTEPGAGSDAAALDDARACATATITCSTARSSSSPAPAPATFIVVMARTGGDGPARHFDLHRSGQDRRASRSAPTSARWAGTRSRPAR